MATYESGNAEGPPGRHPARGPRAGAAPRLRDHGSTADAQRRPGRPADRHGISGPAPPGTGRPGSGGLVNSRRPPPPRLPAHPGGPPGPGPRAQHLAGLLRARLCSPSARTASDELAMSRHSPPEPGAGPTMERYLAEVTARLSGPPRGHSGIMAELRSGIATWQELAWSAT